MDREHCGSMWNLSWDVLMQKIYELGSKNISLTDLTRDEEVIALEIPPFLLKKDLAIYNEWRERKRQLNGL